METLTFWKASMENCLISVGAHPLQWVMHSSKYSFTASSVKSTAGGVTVPLLVQVFICFLSILVG